MRRIAHFALGAVLVGLALARPVAAAADHGVGRAREARPHGRFGLVPQLGIEGPVRTPPASSGQLAYGGGIDGIGVTTGTPKVYVVYWGTQWGTASTNGSGYTVFTNDSAGYAPDQQAFFKGLGTGGELWDGVMTQYCQGVATGSTSCPSGSAQVGYPTGGALAGVWYDNAATSPATASQAQIAAEAVAASTHFGNTTATANRNAEYVITSPKGSNPDNYKTGGFCAWHDYTTSGNGDLAYTNMPYLLDVGSSCGQGFVNSPGTLDGVTIVGGHEYAETTTDQNPAGGWTDSAGAENGDKCAWISSGQGASQNISLTTGTFAVQSTWANDFNGGEGGCEVSHAIVGGSSPDFTLTASPTSLTVALGASGAIQLTTAVTGGFNASILLSVSGLPAGTTGTFSKNPIPAPGSGSSSLTLVVGSATVPGTYTLTARSTGGGHTHTRTIHLTVGTTTPPNLVQNPGFETGTAAPWTADPYVVSDDPAEPPHAGIWDAWLDGYGSSHVDRLSQPISIPSGTSASLSFYLHVDTDDAGSTAHDTLKVQVFDANGAVLKTLGTYSNLTAKAGYSKHTFTMTAFLGQTVRISLVGTEDASLQTSFVVDDFSLTTA